MAGENGGKGTGSGVGLTEAPGFVWEALADRQRADAEASRAEARLRNAEALTSELHAEVGQISRDREVEKRAEELTADKYHRRYVFTGEVSANAVNTCIKQLQTWVRQLPQDETMTIQLVINSPGGSIFDGFALIDFLRQLQADGHKIVTEALGMAASMAGVLLQVGDTRVMGEHAFLLIHEAQFGAVGSMGDIEDRVALVEMMHERILELFAARSKMTKAAIKRKWTRRDWWISAPEAAKLGFVDRIGAVVADGDVDAPVA